MRSVTPGGPEGGLVAILGLVLAALLLLSQALFVVPAGEVAVVTTLGKVSGSSRQPGLNTKLPLVQQVWPSVFAPRFALKILQLSQRICR